MTSKRYILTRKLASGGMADVLLARQQGLAGVEKLVVIKRILSHLRKDGKFVQMFLDEARLAALLQHPNIVEILDIHRDADDFHVVMEYLSGEDLHFIMRAVRQDEGTIPIGVITRIIMDAAAGLTHAHEAADPDGRPLGLVHRDIGPSNMIITYDGTTKLIDFGVAKANIHNIYTQPGTLKGKYAYCSPEQVTHQPLDARSDVFSLGVVFYELLTGRRLFRGESPPQVLKSVMETRILPPSKLNESVPPEIDQIVLKMLKRNPESRLSSARLVRELVSKTVEKLGISANDSAVGDWMKSVFSTQYNQRKRLERAVMSETFNTPVRTSELPAAFLPEYQEESVVYGSQYTQTGVPARSVSGATIAILSAVGTLMLGALIALAFWWGRSGTESPNHSPAAQPAPPNPAIAGSPAAVSSVALLLHVVPEGSTLVVNGKRLPQKVGVDGLLVPSQPDAPIRLQVSKPGYESHEQVTGAPSSGTKNIYVNLVRIEPSRSVRPADLADQVVTEVVQQKEEQDPKTRKNRSNRSRRRPRSRRSQNSKQAALQGASTQAAVQLEYTPSNASLVLDGTVLSGKSPRTLNNLEPGKHRIQLKAKGYRTLDRVIQVKSGQIHTFTLALKQARQAKKLGRLDIMTMPAGAKIFVDGKPRGRTPLLGLMLDAGREVALAAELDGYRRWTTQLVPSPGNNPTVVASLESAGLAKLATSKSKTTDKKLRVPKKMIGNAARGERVFESKCTSCHGVSAPPVNPRRYTRVQWSRYFATARHARRAPLFSLFNLDELAAVKAYLMEHAADTESATAAGVR